MIENILMILIVFNAIHCIVKTDIPDSKPGKISKRNKYYLTLFIISVLMSTVQNWVVFQYWCEDYHFGTVSSALIYILFFILFYIISVSLHMGYLVVFDKETYNLIMSSEKDK